MALDYLTHLRAESDRFLEVLRGADPHARVPSCPDWDADDLLWHLAGVQSFWATIVEDRRQSPDGLDENPERPAEREAMLDYFAEQSERLERVLREADPAEAVWMWSNDKTVGYIRRRQAHEALIHRLDAELVASDVTPLDPELAADGVLELLDMMYGGCPPWGSFEAGEDHVSVRTTDTRLVVPVVLGRFSGKDPDDGVEYDDEDISVQAADPDAVPKVVVTGRAADLDAWLWHRRDETDITVEGDPEVTERLRTLLRQPLN